MLNNKSNFTLKEYLKYQKKLFTLDIKDSLMVVFPSSIYLSFYKKSDIRLGSQNVSRFPNGSHTGEISASQLKSLGVEYVLVGHSERRSEQEEDDNIIRDKIKMLLEQGIKIVLCVGETLEQRKNSESVTVVINQIKNAIDGLDIDFNNLIIAYEPVWAIGKAGEVAKLSDIEDMIKAIKDFIPVKVLYGGSVDYTNVSDINSLLLDGFLLGRSSLDVDGLQKLINIVNK